MDIVENLYNIKKHDKYCIIEGCGRKFHAGEYCDVHYARMKRNGTTDKLPKRKFSRLCSIPKCCKKHEGKGYCVKHLARFIKWGDPNKIGSVKGVKRSEKTKQLQSKLKKEFYTNGGVHPMLGRNHTSESNEKNRVGAYNRGVNSEKFKNTKPERFLKSILSVNGIEYESQKKLYGMPDIFIKPNICIFADGDYHHQNPEFLKHKGCPNVLYSSFGRIKTSKQKWEHDKKINKKLKEQNYTVLRFWEHEICENIIDCFTRIKSEVS